MYKHSYGLLTCIDIPTAKKYTESTPKLICSLQEDIKMYDRYNNGSLKLEIEYLNENYEELVKSNKHI